MRIVILLAGTALGMQGCAGAPPAPEAAAAAAVEETENPFPGTTRRQGPNGDTLYCWSELATGSRIPSQICATESVLRERGIAARQSLEDIRDPAGRGGCNPSAGPC